jgi:hypothetical protein
MKEKRLGEVLRERNQVSADDLNKAIQDQQGRPVHLGELMLQRGIVSKVHLVSALAEVARIQYVDCILVDEAVVTPVPDISASGMFINTTRKFPEGAVLNLRFHLEPTGPEVQMRSEVRYCLPGVGLGSNSSGQLILQSTPSLPRSNRSAAPNLQARDQRGDPNPLAAGPESRNGFRGGTLLTFFNIGNGSVDEHSHALHFFLYCCA